MGCGVGTSQPPTHPQHSADAALQVVDGVPFDGLAAGRSAGLLTCKTNAIKAWLPRYGVQASDVFDSGWRAEVAGGRTAARRAELTLQRLCPRDGNRRLLAQRHPDLRRIRGRTRRRRHRRAWPTAALTVPGCCAWRGCAWIARRTCCGDVGAVGAVGDSLASSVGTRTGLLQHTRPARSVRARAAAPWRPAAPLARGHHGRGRPPWPAPGAAQSSRGSMLGPGSTPRGGQMLYSKREPINRSTIIERFSYKIQHARFDIHSNNKFLVLVQYVFKNMKCRLKFRVGTTLLVFF